MFRVLRGHETARADIRQVLRAHALASRNSLITALARDLGHHTAHARASAVRAYLTAYAASAWQTDRREPEPPTEATETRVLAFRILKLCDGDVLGLRQITSILKSSGDAGETAEPKAGLHKSRSKLQTKRSDGRATSIRNP